MSERDREIDIMDVFKHLWSKKIGLLKWVVIGILVGVVVVISTPKEYICKVSVAPENKQNSQMSSMGGLASMMGVSVGGGQGGITQSVYPAILQSSPFISEFIDVSVKRDGEDIPLINYLLEQEKLPWWSYLAPSRMMNLFKSKKEVVVSDDQFRPTGFQKSFESKFTSRVSLETESKSGLISLEVTMQDAESAAIIADSLISKLQRYMVQYYTSKNRFDLESNIEILDNAQAKFYTADSLYAQAVDRNRNLISHLAQVRIERLKNERDIAYSIYKQVASQVELTRHKLQEETPIVTVVEPARVPNSKSTPRTSLILAGFAFMAALIYCVWQLFAFINRGDNVEISE